MQSAVLGTKAALVHTMVNSTSCAVQMASDSWQARSLGLCSEQGLQWAGVWDMIPADVQPPQSTYYIPKAKSLRAAGHGCFGKVA